MAKSVNPVIGVKGMDVVLSNLAKEILKIKGRSMKGLIEASIIIRRDMEQTYPLIPVDLGNLRASWFTVNSMGLASSEDKGFEGKHAGEMASDHASTKSQAGSLVKSASVKGPVLMMGFSANYALFVHENINAKFSGRPGKKPGRPNSGAKFFESALKRNKGKIIEVIQQNAIIKR